jgi:hypothetical protein
MQTNSRFGTFVFDVFFRKNPMKFSKQLRLLLFSHVKLISHTSGQWNPRKREDAGQAGYLAGFDPPGNAREENALAPWGGNLRDRPAEQAAGGSEQRRRRHPSLLNREGHARGDGRANPSCLPAVERKRNGALFFLSPATLFSFLISLTLRLIFFAW